MFSGDQFYTQCLPYVQKTCERTWPVFWINN